MQYSKVQMQSPKEGCAQGVPLAHPSFGRIRFAAGLCLYQKFIDFSERREFFHLLSLTNYRTLRW